VTTGPQVERREDPIEDVPVDLVEAAARVGEAGESGGEGGEEDARRQGGADRRGRATAGPRPAAEFRCGRREAAPGRGEHATGRTREGESRRAAELQASATGRARERSR
jgi:hypothetical protein